jgi:hypothetical protein
MSASKLKNHSLRVSEREVKDIQTRTVMELKNHFLDSNAKLDIVGVFAFDMKKQLEAEYSAFLDSEEAKTKEQKQNVEKTNLLSLTKTQSKTTSDTVNKNTHDEYDEIFESLFTRSSECGNVSASARMTNPR